MSVMCAAWWCELSLSWRGIGVGTIVNCMRCEVLFRLQMLVLSFYYELIGAHHCHRFIRVIRFISSQCRKT
jgi:hypothetical protein